MSYFKVKVVKLIQCMLEPWQWLFSGFKPKVGYFCFFYLMFSVLFIHIFNQQSLNGFTNWYYVFSAELNKAGINSNSSKIM